MTGYSFSASDYERMIAAGIFVEDERIELVAGKIIKMSPVSGRHVGCVNTLADLLFSVAGATTTVSVQNPIRLATCDQPQPDLAVLRGVGQGLVDASEVLLVIEVADVASREYDRTTKLPRYAAAGIPEAWLVDLDSDTIERYSEPRNGHYRFAAFATRGDLLASTVLLALTIPTDAVPVRLKTEP